MDKKKPTTGKKKDKLSTLESLLKKLLDEGLFEYSNSDDNLFSMLDDDEIEVLEELLDKVELYVEYGGPILIILVPIIIWWCKRRLVENRMRAFAEQAR